MSNETETAAVPASSQTTIVDDKIQLLTAAVRSLPSHAVKDLLSTGVCERCIVRLLGIQERVTIFSLVSTSVLLSMLVGNEDDMSDFPASKDSEICRICLGVLQFTYCDDKDILVKKDNGHDFAAAIVEGMKQEGHQIQSFSLEISLPSIITENENLAWLYMKTKYGSEVWFQDRSSERVSAKDDLKCLLTNLLEDLLGVKSGGTCFRVRLTYDNASNSVENCALVDQGAKRRKTDSENGSNTNTSEENGCTERSFSDKEDPEFLKCQELCLDKVNEPCRLVLFTNSMPIFFGGRYLKYSRNVSQTRWIIDDERMGEVSVGEIIGGNVLPMCRGDDYKFHAAGREDIDVRMLGSGRPFLVEIQNPRQTPSELLVRETEAKINKLGHGLVGVRNLKLVGSEGWTLMREGEAEKQKQYAALVWISRPLEDKDMQLVSSFKDLQIMQGTPVRVLHRRSPLEREKIIHWMRVEKIDESSQYFLLHLCTQAGTYIKEFVHGDLGRTHPSIGSILGCRSEILQLDVTDVKMDCFLT